MNKSASIQFTPRTQDLFTKILTYHFKRKPSKFDRQTLFCTYSSLLFRKASGSPLLALLKQNLVTECNAIEVLVKNGNREINDTDLESVIKIVRGNPATLFILVTSSEVDSDDLERLYRVFTRYQVTILLLGEDDISRLEGFVENGNINACIVVLATLANQIATGTERVTSVWAERLKRQKEALEKRLDKMGKLKTPQVRTLVKKLAFFMNFEKAGGDIAKACDAIKISRKLFYLWCDSDPVFRKIVYNSRL